MRTYISHNDMLHYRLINIKTDHPAPENQNNRLVFKGKTIANAIKSAKRYCDEKNQKTFYKSWVGEVLYECDYRGRKIRQKDN